MTPPTLEERIGRTRPAVDRVLDRVAYSDTPFNGTPCWVFTGCLSTSGYGQVSIGSRVDGTQRNVQAHRVTYEALVGPIPAGLNLDHLCRVTSCVNPAHAEPVTQRVNVLRGAGPTALNAQRTECYRGHPFDDENTYVGPRGNRACRECARRNKDAFNERKKALA